jgi:hypothetical protein
VGALLFRNPVYQFVTQEHVNGFFISTAWLGFDHGHPRGQGRPLIFETAVFHDGQWAELDGWRCRTEAQALERHRYCVERARAGQYPDPDRSQPNP